MPHAFDFNQQAIPGIDPIIGQSQIDVIDQPIVAVPSDVVAVDTVAGETSQTTNPQKSGIPTKISPIVVAISIVGLLFLFGNIK